MEQAEMMQVLFAKMSAEQGGYRKWLVSLPPEEILEHAYEYTVREAALSLMGKMELSKGQITALFATKTPLTGICDEFFSRDIDYEIELTDCIEVFANEAADRYERVKKAAAQLEFWNGAINGLP